MKLRAGTLDGDRNTLQVKAYWPEGKVIQLRCFKIAQEMYRDLEVLAQVDVMAQEEIVRQLVQEAV